MAANDLTTVAQVMAYIGPGANAAPDVFAQLVTAASTFVQTLTGRTFLATAYVSDIYDGPGTHRLILRQSPIISVESVSIGTYRPSPQPVDASLNPCGVGYVIRKEFLDFIGATWCRGRDNITVSYTAGYPDPVVLAEPVNVPAVAPYTTTLLGSSLLRAIQNLRYALTGVPFVRVAANPVAGQYTLSPAAQLGFAAADASAALLCDYTTNGTPADLMQAVNEIVGYKFAKRNRLDKKSETLATQTVAYDMSDVPSSARTVLDLYSPPFLV